MNKAVDTYHVFKPDIFGVVFSAFFATVTKNGFNFVFLLILNIRVHVIPIAVFVCLFKLFKVLDIVNIVGDLGAPTRNADFLGG